MERPMKNIRFAMVVLVAGLLVAAACKKNPKHEEGPAESAGEEIDEAGREVKEETKEAVDDTGDAADEAGENVEEAVEGDN
jgi:hypothetical protein